jgi:hypothetical protein
MTVIYSHRNIDGNFFVPRFERFTVLLTKQERQRIVDLAAYFERTQSDTVRMLINNTAAALELTKSKNQPNNQGSTDGQIGCK